MINANWGWFIIWVASLSATSLSLAQKALLFRVGLATDCHGPYRGRLGRCCARGISENHREDLTIGHCCGGVQRVHRQWQKTDIRTGVKWSSKHSPNIKSFISAMCFLGEVPSLRGSHLDSFCTHWNHTQHVKDVLPSGAGLQFPWFLRFRGGISPMHPRDQAIGGIVDFLRLAGDWFRINLGLRINL